MKTWAMGALILTTLAWSGPLTAVDVGTFNNDGGWCWFQDERVVVDGSNLLIASVASGTRDPSRQGDIEVVSYHLESGKLTRFELHDRLLLNFRGRTAQDDHNAPALLVRPDGRYLAVYANHGRDNQILYRVSTRPHDATAWDPEQILVPSDISRVTYSNLHFLSGENGRIYNFFRGYNASNKPSYAWSEDQGATWKIGGVFLDVPDMTPCRPYVKYASDGRDTIHMFYSESTPYSFDTSVYHVYYRKEMLHKSDGTPIRALSPGLRHPDEGTLIYRGNSQNVVWMSDIHVDSKGRPWVAYTLRKGTLKDPEGQVGADHRYRYARWSGKRWLDHEIAYAGSQLYRGEDDYTGLITLDPEDPHTVYISTNAHPVSGQPLVSKVDGKRHWEIFRGVTTSDGVTWKWTPVTRDSTADNIRPVVPVWKDKRYALLWLRGTLRTYTDYDLAVVGFIERR
ncbi:MAG TPA: BNR-4 repeat-containing protein [Bryobacteraceae bacterium]|nr:BNR-4 repeat-containing protein [Bryobacteraceae bacterium]